MAYPASSTIDLLICNGAVRRIAITIPSNESLLRLINALIPMLDLGDQGRGRRRVANIRLGGRAFSNANATASSLGLPRRAEFRVRITYDVKLWILHYERATSTFLGVTEEEHSEGARITNITDPMTAFAVSIHRRVFFKSGDDEEFTQNSTVRSSGVAASRIIFAYWA